MSAKPADRLVLPLAPTAPVAAAPKPVATAQLEEPPPEPPGLMDRPIVETVGSAARQLAEPARAAVAWGRQLADRAVKKYGGLASKTKPMIAASVAALVAWFLVRTLGSMVQLAAVALAAYVAFGVLS